MRKLPKSQCGIHIIHIHIFSEKSLSFRSDQTALFQQKRIPGIYIGDQLTDFPAGRSKICLLHIGKTHKKDRIGSLQSAILFLLPYRQSLKKLTPARIFQREKFLQHTHVQCLSETPRPGDQRHIIIRLPPLSDQIRLIHIKIMMHSDLLEILSTNPNCPQCVQSFPQPLQTAVNNRTKASSKIPHP